MKDFTFNKSFADKPSVNELRAEFESLKLVLESLKTLTGLSYKAIDDVPDNLGLELFFNAQKIAELYCDEEDDQILPHRYIVYSRIDDYQHQVLTLDECCWHFSRYINTP